MSRAGSGAAPPSRFHRGRRGFNYSIFDAGDRQMVRLQDRFRGTLLDLGCGERDYEAFLSCHCERYVGVDWAQSMHAHVADIVADLNRPLPFADAAVDTVTCLSVLEHLREPATLLAEAARVLRPGGHLVLQVPFMWHVHEAPHDYFRYTGYGLEYLLQRAGFDAIEIVPTTGFWQMWTLKLNYQLVRLARLRGWGGRLAALFLAPLFRLDQWLALRLDRVWGATAGETAGYFASARKPGPQV